MCDLRWSVAIVATIALLPINASADEAAEKKKLEGKWRVVGLQSRGKDDLGASFRGMIWEFGEKEYVLTPGATTPAGLSGKPKLSVPYSLDVKKSPKHFTQTLGERSLLGIYRFKDGQLHVCLARYKHPRPTQFDTQGEKNWLCYRLERIKQTPKAVEASDSKE